MTNYKTFLATMAAITLMAGASYADTAPPKQLPGGGLEGATAIIVPVPPGVYNRGEVNSKDLALWALEYCLRWGYEYGEADIWPSESPGAPDGPGKLKVTINCYEHGQY